MKVVRDVLGMSPDDPRYESCQEIGKRIEVLLAASKDPLRQAIVTLLDYDSGDIEEYATLIYDVIQLLPPEKVP